MKRHRDLQLYAAEKVDILAQDQHICPRCGHQNQIVDWGIIKARARMECASCGSVWKIIGEPTIFNRDMNIADDKVSISAPNWHAYNGRKSVITSGIFTAGSNGPVRNALLYVDGQENNDSLIDQLSQEQKRFVPRHVAGMVAVMAVLIVLSEVNFSTLADFGASTLTSTLKGAIDPITTASVQNKIEESPVRIGEIKFYKMVSGNNAFISVHGRIRNISVKVVENPKITIELRNIQNKTVKQWHYQLTGQNLLPGQIAKFNSEVMNNGSLVKSVVVNYSGQG